MPASFLSITVIVLAPSLLIFTWAAWHSGVFENQKWWRF